MLDGHAELPGLENESNGAAEQRDESDSDEVEITEIRLIPDEVESLETIFNAIRVCQELNPDPQDSVSGTFYVYDLPTIQRFTSDCQQYKILFDDIV